MGLFEQEIALRQHLMAVSDREQEMFKVALANHLGCEVQDIVETLRKTHKAGYGEVHIDHCEAVVYAYEYTIAYRYDTLDNNPQVVVTVI